METNFDYLVEKTEYADFAMQAVEAEKSISISPATCAILSRRALELAVRYVYSIDAGLELPYQDNISSLIHESTFRKIIEPRLFPMLKYTIHLGNVAVHTNSMIKRDEAILSLRNLFEFCNWITYSYEKKYTERSFDESVLASGDEKRVKAQELKDLYDNLSSKDQKLADVLKENEELRDSMSEMRQKNTSVRVFHVDHISEAKTREKYIDVALKEAGWTIGGNCTVEVPVVGMPNATGTGFVDYVLWGKDNLPLAVVEAKRVDVDTIVGSQQAKLYADCLEKQYGRRPVIYTVNGFDFDYLDDSLGYSRRRVSGFRTQEELQLEVDRRTQRIPMNVIEISDAITDRPYQKEAVTAVCDAIMQKHRKMLIVQATGSGKTRVSISIVDVLRRHNYVKNILFLADRTALVKQAKNSFANRLQDLSCCNLLDANDDPESARMIFSTYPTMMNAIDETKNKFGEKVFSPGHFDLIICDEVHRSVYRKYQEIFEYFDAMLLGMTATPKSEIGRNTYEIFDLENEVPTFAYELEKAVEEGYLVNYSTLEYKTKIMEDGIHYDELSEEEKEEYEDKFGGIEGFEEGISNTAINQWLFNYDTIDKVLIELMEKGLKVEGGDELGKTIIFAKNSNHAKVIVERFYKLFPEKGDNYIKQIDYSIKYVDTLIDEFSTKSKLPQIAVSVDMLDTGIDIPEILNLVFFKKVKSYAKFWQMIGRGTRSCPNLLGVGKDKERFLIFDFCNNFEYFRVNTNGSETGVQQSISEKLFNVKTLICRELQNPSYASQEMYVNLRDDMTTSLNELVVELDDSSFVVKNHMRFVEYYRNIQAWQRLESINVSEIKEHIAPIVKPTGDNELIKRFDHLMYSIELGLLMGSNITKQVNIVVSTAEALSTKGVIPEYVTDYQKRKDLASQLQTPDFWEDVSVLEIENARVLLRDMILFIPPVSAKSFYTDFGDTIISQVEGEPIYGGVNLQNYRKKVEHYLKQHQDNLSVFKLRNNKPLTEADVRELERILWTELGSREDYIKEYGDTPVGHLIRQIVGVERSAVNEAFSKFLSDERLNLNQIRFINLIVDYIAKNGNIEDNSVLMEQPFKTVGTITALFKDDMDTARQIMGVIEEIKRNSDSIA